MDDDDDFMPSTQIGSRRQPSQRPSQSQIPSSSQDPQLSSSQRSMLLNYVLQLEDSGLRGIKRPAEQKPLDKKPKRSEEFKCLIKHCKSVLKNKTNLFRHMKTIHDIMDPERLYGCTMDNTIVNLDESLMEHKCLHCEFFTNNINAMDAHNATRHGILPSVSCKVCSFKTNSSEELAVHSRSHVASTSTAFESFKDKMHKCNDCLCYFEEKSKFEEHMKMQHGFEAECKICNKNFLFKDFDSHVKSSHPEVYGKKNEVEAKEKIVKVNLKLKSGKVKHVFKCKKCNARFDDENKARRHAKIHYKVVKAKVVNEQRVVKNVNQKDSPPENNILFVCETCDIACVSYDAAVQHSQNHITKPNATFVTKTCDTCRFKFESLCYEKHLDRHYRDKQLNRESFKTVKYKFNLLLSKDWIDSFNSDLDIKKIEAQSIHGSARSVKMRVISESAISSKMINLYQCGKCDTFVEPTSVTNHTLNYDTCMKIKHSFACNVCKRKFNTSFHRDKHEKVHDGNESFRIIVFNAERDKEFNDILNNPNTGLMLQNRENHAEANNNQNDVNNIDRHDEIVYKCMCGLCFVSKRKAEDHTKVCPGKDTKQNCPKCNSLFNISELVSHLEHHLNGATRFKIEDFVPEPIVIDSDDDLENSNNTKGGEKNEGNKDIKVEHRNRFVSNETNNDVPVFEVLDSDEEIEGISQAVTNIPDEQTNTQAETMPATPTPNEDIPMEEMEDEVCSYDYESDDQINNEANQEVELTLDDSQNLSSEAVEDTQTESLQLNKCDVTNKNNKIKCIPTSQLLGSVRDNGYSRAIENNAINISEIEAIRRSIERNETLVTPSTTVKQEKPWLWDPTDYSYIGPRPSLRQIDISHTRITHTIEETDDEDDLFLQLPSGSQLGNDFNERHSNNDVTNDIPSARDQTVNNTEEEMNTCDTVLTNNTFNIIENVASEVQPENETVRSETVENNDNLAQSNSAVVLNGVLDCVTNRDDSEGINSIVHSNDQTSPLRQTNHNLGDASYCSNTEQIEDEMNAIEGHSESRDAEIGTGDELSSNEVSRNSREKNPDEALTVSDNLRETADIKKETYDESELKNKLITQTDQVIMASDYSKRTQFKMEPKELECERENNSEIIQVRNEPIDFAIDLRNAHNENRLIRRNDSNDYAIVTYRNEIGNEWNDQERTVASISPSVQDVYSHNYSRRALNEIDNNGGRTNRVMQTANRALNVARAPVQGGPNNRRYRFENEIDNYNFDRNDAIFQNANDFRNNRVDFNLSVVMSDQNVMVKPNNGCCIS